MEKHDNYITLIRKELYDAVWSKPAVKLAKEYGVSDVAINKACKRHNIPRPCRGYWEQKYHGKSVRKQKSDPELSEKAYREKHGVGRSSDFGYFRTPSGRLGLEITDLIFDNGFRRNWRDGQNQRLENLLDKFIAGMELIAQKKREKEIEHERWKREREEKERRHRERVERYNRESARLSQLKSNTAAWRQSFEIREYVEAVRRKAEENGVCTNEKSEMGQWIKWALEQADRIDPLAEGPPSILDDPPSKSIL